MMPSVNNINHVNQDAAEWHSKWAKYHYNCFSRAKNDEAKKYHASKVKHHCYHISLYHKGHEIMAKAIGGDMSKFKDAIDWLEKSRTKGSKDKHKRKAHAKKHEEYEHTDEQHRHMALAQMHRNSADMYEDWAHAQKEPYKKDNLLWRSKQFDEMSRDHAREAGVARSHIHHHISTGTADGKAIQGHIERLHLKRAKKTGSGN